MTVKPPTKPWRLPSQKSYTFKNCNLVDTITGTIIPNQTIGIFGGYIVSVSQTKPEELHTNTIIVDLNGKYLCPGLIDNHVHVTAVPGEKTLGDLYNLSPTISLLRQPHVCTQMLQRGFTSARDCGGASLELKQAIEEGLIPGPRLFIAGHALSQTGGHGDTRSSHDHTDCCGGTIMSLSRLCDGVAECLKTAREELRCGADFIKIMAGGGVASPTDKLEHVQFTAEEVRGISEVARNANTYVTAHAYTTSSIRHAVDNGAKGIEHGNLIDEETAKYMAERDVFLTPTLVTYAEMAATGFLPPELEEKNNKVLEAGLKSLEMASNAGVTICYGTDLLGSMGVAQTKEFALRAQVLSPKAILQSATVNPAKRMGKIGWIGKGYLADMLILNENPLENIKIFDHPESYLLAVIKDGRVFHSRWSKLPQDVVKESRIIE